MVLDAGQDEIRLQDLSPELFADSNTSAFSSSEGDDAEKDRILQALRKCDGNQSKAAALLGMHRNTMGNKIRHYGLNRYSATGEGKGNG